MDRLLPAALARAGLDGEPLDGLVLTGGCGLNVPANYALAQR